MAMNFPDSPTLNQVFNAYTWDGEKWINTVGGIPMPDPAATITSSASVSNIENAVLAHSLTASESVTWSLVGGADIAEFELSGSTLRWAGNGVQDFENPDDANDDNVYVVTVRATDSGSQTTDQTVSVTVTNVGEVVDDPYWSSVKLLMGFNGVDGATGAPGMSDESPVARGNATVISPAQIDTAQSKFGGSSLLLGGAGDYLTYPDSADWDFGTGQFTIEGFFRFSVAPANCTLVCQWSGGWALFFEAATFLFRPGSYTDTTPYSWYPALNQWYHIAVDRDVSSTIRIYVDGAMVTKTTSYAANLTGSAALLAIGSLRAAGFTTYDLNGHVDELRITKGVARYASDSGYTVPTAAFPRTGPIYVTWNAATATAITLSGDDLVATNTGGVSADQGIRTSASSARKTTGKYYFETTLTTITTVGNSMSVAVAASTSTHLTLSANASTGAGYYPVGVGNIYVNGAASGSTLGAGGAGNIIGVAVDLDNRTIWFRKSPSGNWNGSGTANPATNTGGFTIPSGPMMPFAVFGGSPGISGNVTTTNFGASAFSGVVPSGFTAGWPINPPSTYVVWDTVTNVTLSSDYLVATNTGTSSADQGAKVASASGKTSGKYYFEVTNTTLASTGGGNRSCGVGTTASTYTGMGNSATTGNTAYFSSGSIYANGAGPAGAIGSAIIQGDICSVAVDLDNRRIWFRKAPSGNWNNNASNNPATNVGGVTIPAGTMVPFVTFGGASGVANNVFTANFGATSFSGTVPSGFTSGWPT